MDTFEKTAGRQLVLAPVDNTLYGTIVFALLEPDPDDGEQAAVQQQKRWRRTLTAVLCHPDNDELQRLLAHARWRRWTVPWGGLAQDAMRDHDLPRLLRVLELGGNEPYNRWFLIETGLKCNAPDALLLAVLDHADDTSVWPWERLCRPAMMRETSDVFWRLYALGGAKTRRYLREAGQRYGRDSATYKLFRQTGDVTVRRLPWWQRLTWWWRSFGLARTLLIG